MAYILINNLSKYVQVDDLFYPYINQYRWFARKDKDKNHYIFYAYMSAKFTILPRYIMWLTTKRWTPKKLCVSYISHDRYDNRLSNLRETSPANIIYNAIRTKNMTGLRGVCEDPPNSGIFKASISVDKKRRNLGRFKTKEDAYQKYKDEMKKIDYVAWCNLP